MYVQQPEKQEVTEIFPCEKKNCLERSVYSSCSIHFQIIQNTAPPDSVTLVKAVAIYCPLSLLQNHKLQKIKGMQRQTSNIVESPSGSKSQGLLSSELHVCGYFSLLPWIHQTKLDKKLFLLVMHCFLKTQGVKQDFLDFFFFH